MTRSVIVVEQSFFDQRDEQRAGATAHPHIIVGARNAFSYAPLRIVARVPITPTCRLRVACNAARAPGSITPITGTGNFFVNLGSATDETVLHATTSAFAFFCISISASSSA